MSKPVSPVAAALSLIAAAPGAAYGDAYACDYCDLFPYKPLRMQIEGGRTITQGWGAQYLDNGMNVGLGLTWQPKAELPLALRADAMYQQFDATQLLVSQAAANFGKNVDEGSVKMWGGDIDAELDLKVTDSARFYFLVGVGWFDEQNSFHYQGTLVSRNTTGTHFERNAGLGVEFGNGGTMFFFIDARYMRFNINGQNLDLIPIRLGLRF
jgi:opacity protein-like surface antigen